LRSGASLAEPLEALSALCPESSYSSTWGRFRLLSAITQLLARMRGRARLVVLADDADRIPVPHVTLSAPHRAGNIVIAACEGGAVRDLDDIADLVVTLDDLPRDATPLTIVDRSSTAAEQTCFTAAAGAELGEALATVNSALATWPSLRQERTPGFKDDLVAVCLYLSRCRAAVVNEAARAGVAAPIEAHLPSLASGIRRLPVHRKVVLRQATTTGTTDSCSRPATLLTESGFLSASMDLDVTVPGAEIDVLIRPATAHRISQFRSGRGAEEAIFVAGARFKALALRRIERSADPKAGETVEAPRVAALLRELAPDEHASVCDLTERDLDVLAKLDRVLAHRQEHALRLVEAPGAVGRFTTTMVEWRASAPDPDDWPAAAAS
jgi:hypothetical protein